MDEFSARLKALPTGYSEVAYEGRRYGLTVSAPPDGRRLWLYAEELGGRDRISCNVYTLSDGAMALRPCEMPAENVIRFVLRLRPDQAEPKPATTSSTSRKVSRKRNGTVGWS